MLHVQYLLDPHRSAPKLASPRCSGLGWAKVQYLTSPYSIHMYFRPRVRRPMTESRGLTIQVLQVRST